MNKAPKILFAGGGTGGHLFPAVAVAERVLEKAPESKIVFVGSKSKIEGKVIPQLGYRFFPIWISGFSRSQNIKNLLFPVKLVVSLLQSLWLNLTFRPHVAVGTGGYASGPAVFVAHLLGARVVLLEQNSYPGITTRLLERYADEIHLSLEKAKDYLHNKSKIFVSGNPIRKELGKTNRLEAAKKLGIDADKKTLVVLGGSLGAKTINQSICKALDELVAEDIQIVWQTGSNYYERYKSKESKNIKIIPFIDSMADVYGVADVIVSRAGATTIAEITSLGIASVLVPSPNVAENHQYHNAISLVEKEAALLVEDSNAHESLVVAIKELLNNDELRQKIKNNATAISFPNAATEIAERILKLSNSYPIA